MEEPRLVIRFDIDTIVCVRQGVINSLLLAEEKGVKFTYFVNMGRAISYWSLVRKSLVRKRTEGDVTPEKLSPLNKLGLKGFIFTVLCNPKVGFGGVDNLKKLVSGGHDLGLHGGRNHGAWHHDANRWSAQRIEAEIEWGRRAFLLAGLPEPKMFASPGFSSPDALKNILPLKGFNVLADDHERDMAVLSESGVPEFLRVNTAMLGCPGNVGYIESSFVKSMSENELRREVEVFFSEGDAVLYDHPCFAAREGLQRLSFVIDAWRKLGGRVVPLSELVDNSLSVRN